MSGMHAKRSPAEERIMVAAGWVIAIGLLTITPCVACVMGAQYVWRWARGLLHRDAHSGDPETPAVAGACERATPMNPAKAL
jgi:hypothetical protein